MTDSNINRRNRKIAANGGVEPEKKRPGRPKGKVSMAKLIMSEAAKEHALDALETLVDICKDRKAPAPARVSAATAILDRAFGKPAQAVKLGGDGENPLGAMIQFYLPDNERQQD